MYLLHALSPGAGAILKQDNFFYLSTYENPEKITPIEEIMVASRVSKFGYDMAQHEILLENPKDWRDNYGDQNSWRFYE